MSLHYSHAAASFPLDLIYSNSLHYIIPQQIEGEKVEVVTDFLFLSSKITVNGDCSHEIPRKFLLGRKAMTNLDSEWKSRDIPLLTKVYIVKAMVF